MHARSCVFFCVYFLVIIMDMDMALGTRDSGPKTEKTKNRIGAVWI